MVSLVVSNGRRTLVTMGGNPWSFLAPLLSPAYLPSNHMPRTFATKGNGDKNKAMKRQLQRNPVPPQPFHPIKPPSTSFNIISNNGNSNSNQDPIVSSSQFSQQQLFGSPIHAAPALTWETDKLSLSSLPDDAASLMDKEELFDPSIHLPYAPKDWKGYEPATPLSDFLMSRIGVAGRAITTAEYMRHALTHPSFGYYTNPPSLRDKRGDDDFETNEWDQPPSDGTIANDSTLIGPRGDFITAPEVSHVFGHCLCVWFVTQWKSPLLNKPQQIQLVELGPGRGTLMTDILQLATASTLQDFGKTITTVNLVEASRVLREQQQAALNERLGDIIDFEFVHKSPFLTMKNEEGGKAKQNSTVATTSTKKFQMRIEWHDTFTSFARNRDKDIPVFVVAQEFLDALPVHSFQKTEEGWRERLIDVASVEDEPPQESEVELRPRLRQVLAPDVTPAVKLFIEPNRQYDHVPDGTVIEVCPEAILLVQDISKVLEQSRGVALMIDYGQDGTADTLRAFSNHKQVPLTSRPGQVDVTADVDFFALRNAVQSSSEEVSVARQIHAFGPVPQGEFLMRMGVADMVINSIEQDDTSPDHAQKLSDALKYLVLPQHMGEKFKVLALAPKRDGIFAPAGMEM